MQHKYSGGKSNRVNGTIRVPNVVLYDLDDTAITKPAQGLALRMSQSALREIQTVTKHADYSLRQGLQFFLATTIQTKSFGGGCTGVFAESPGCTVLIYPYGTKSQFRSSFGHLSVHRANWHGILGNLAAAQLGTRNASPTQHDPRGRRWHFATAIFLRKRLEGNCGGNSLLAPLKKLH